MTFVYRSDLNRSSSISKALWKCKLWEGESVEASENPKPCDCWRSVPDYCEFLYSQAVIFPLKPCVSLEKEHFVKLLTFTEQIDKYMLLRWKWPEKKTMKTLCYSENVLDVNLLFRLLINFYSKAC